MEGKYKDPEFEHYTVMATKLLIRSIVYQAKFMWMQRLGVGATVNLF